MGLRSPTLLGRQSQAIPQTAQTFWILKGILILQMFLLRLESLVYCLPSGSTPSWTLVVRSSTTSTWCGAPTPIHWHPNSRPFVMSKSLEKVLYLDVFGNASFLPLSKSDVWSNNESDHVWSVLYSQVGTLAQDCDSKLPFMSVHCAPGFGGRIIHNHTQT